MNTEYRAKDAMYHYRVTKLQGGLERFQMTRSSERDNSLLKTDNSVLISGNKMLMISHFTGCEGYLFPSSIKIVGTMVYYLSLTLYLGRVIWVAECSGRTCV